MRTHTLDALNQSHPSFAGTRASTGFVFDGIAGGVLVQGHSQMRSKLANLSAEHDDLDTAIAAILSIANFDEQLISRLKKRKLHLKDEIVSTAAMLSAIVPNSA
jgi:hypothetical protein